MGVLLAASALLLGAEWGPPFGLGLLVVSGVLAASGVMALVATLARTAEQAGNLESVAAMLLGVLGGVLVPLQQTGALATLSLLTPHQWFMRGLADLHGANPPAVPVVPVLALPGFAAVTLVPALLRAGRMFRP